ETDSVRKLIDTAESVVTSVHALWTLEGLQTLTVDDLSRALSASRSAKVQTAVLRLAAERADSEAFELVRSTSDRGREVGLQRVLAMHKFQDLDQNTVFEELFDAVASRRGDAEFIDAVLGGLEGREEEFQIGRAHV